MTPSELEEIERRAEALGPAIQEVRSLSEEEDFQGGSTRPKGHPTSVQRVQPLLDSAADIPALLSYVRELRGALDEIWAEGAPVARDLAAKALKWSEG